MINVLQGRWQCRRISQHRVPPPPLPPTQSTGHLQIITRVVMCNKSSDTTTAPTPLMFPLGSVSLVHLAPQDSGLVWVRGGVFWGGGWVA